MRRNFSLALGLMAAVCACSAQIPDAPQPATESAIADSLNKETAVNPSISSIFLVAVWSTPVVQPANASERRPVQGDAILQGQRHTQPVRRLLPNSRYISAGLPEQRPEWKYNFMAATRQVTDYSSFCLLGVTSMVAEGSNMHPTLGKGVRGFYAYAWRGFLDKTDNTYMSAWLLPSLLREDPRFYGMGAGHRFPARVLYVLSRQAVTRTYSGVQTPNVAGLGSKIITQAVSKLYYPAEATGFGELAGKFGYSVMRDVALQMLQEFYPDVAAHLHRRHREGIAVAVRSPGVPSLADAPPSAEPLD